MNEEWKKDRFGAIERGENPMVLAKMKSGFAVIGDTQFLPGYCVLLAYPKVNTHGNSDPFLHAHIFPRYEWEPDEKKPNPVWQYKDLWHWKELQYNDEKHAVLRKQITDKLLEVMQKAYSIDNNHQNEAAGM